MGTRVFRLLLGPALGLLLLSGCLPDRPEVSSDLINAFGSSCSSVGGWTQSALRQNEALVQTFSTLAKDEQCQPYLNSIMTVQNAVSRANALLKDDQFLKYRADQEQLQDLTLALQSPPTDGNLAAQLQSQLILTQLSLYQSRAMERASQTVADKDRYAHGTADLAQYLQTVTTAQQSGGMTACLKKHPEAAVGIAANLLALGGSFVSPIYGAQFSVIGQMLNIGVDYASHSATEDAIWQAHQAVMPTALTCGLEAMTELYCDAVDSADLIELKKNSIQNGGADHSAPIWRGVDLLSMRMPVLNGWLSKVRNGITPTDSGLMTKQNAIIDKMASVDRTHNSVYASLSEDKKAYEDSPPSQQTNQMVKTILDQVMLVMNINPSCPSVCGSAPTPFTELTMDPKNYSCWFVMGMVSGVKCLESSSTEGLEPYIRRLLDLNKITFIDLFAHWNQIHETVKTRVEAEFNRTITANPSSLIADAYESSPTNVSPHDVLRMLVEYLSDLKASGGMYNPAYKPHLDETIHLIQEVMAALDPSGPVPGDDTVSKDPSIRRIAEVFHKLELNRGLGIFSDRVSRIVEWDLSAKIKNGEFPKEQADILKLAGFEIKDRLAQSGLGVSDGELNADIGTAMSIAQSNITTFREFFKNDLNRAAVMLQKAAVEAGEPLRGPRRANGQVLGHLCTLILITGKQWPAGFDPSVCEKAYLDPLYGGPNSPAFSIEVGKLVKELEGKPFESRFCAYHRYLRAERLAELPPTSRRADPSARLNSMMGFSDWTNFNLMEMMVR
jgi:hypothetical protein